MIFRRTRILVTLGFFAWLMPATFAQTVWDSGTFFFEKPNNVPTTVRDVIIPESVELTRDIVQGLYNAAQEDGYVFDVSPANTEWAFDNLNGNGDVSIENFATLNYADWRSATRFVPSAPPFPPATVDIDGVLRLVDENIYIAITFTSWNVGSGGGFAYVRAAGPSGGVDSDGDGVGDASDNCVDVANADQLDINMDNIGNACDPDLDDNGVVNFLDVSLFASAFGATGQQAADFNGDGVVNFLDFAIVSGFIFGPPGPSGLVGP